MKMLLKSLLIGCIGLVNVSLAQENDEWETKTRYYEDDAWYDISEWFDGNDYNPTDEEMWEWDDEVFNQDPDETDVDNDPTYGYERSTDRDDWFYDYYDDGAYSSDDFDRDESTHEFGSRYFDFDNDGSFDAYVTWHDRNNDGYYEDYTYYSFNDRGDNSQNADSRKQMPAESKPYSMTGEIQNVKRVKVRGNEHLVVSLQKSDTDLIADLGMAKALSDFNLEQGTEITVKGLKTKVGDKNILMAQTLQMNGQQHTVDRNRREIQGTVLSTHRAPIRGSENIIAMIRPEDSKSKVAVDLGPANKIDVDLKKDTELAFRGVPIKVNDQKMLFAKSIKQDNEWVNIDRRENSRKNQAGSSKDDTR